MAVKTKRQHYIPQFYLKGFSEDEENLHIYDKQVGNKGDYRYQSIKKLAFENNFYTHRLKSGRKGDLEDFFGQFETANGIIIKKISKRIEIDEKDKEMLAMFVALQWMRVPTFKKMLEDSQQQFAEKFMRISMATAPKEWLRKFYAERGENLTDKEIKDLVEFSQDEKRSKVAVSVPQEYWLKQMLTLSMEMTRVLLVLDWQFLYSKQKNGFISTDNPFLMIPTKKIEFPYGVGLLVPGVLKVIPLTSQVCMLMREPNENPVIEYQDLEDKSFQRELNRHLIQRSQRFSFSASKGKLEKLVKDHKPYINRNKKSVYVT